MCPHGYPIMECVKCALLRPRILFRRILNLLKASLIQDDPRPAPNVAWVFDDDAPAFTLEQADFELDNQFRLHPHQRDYDLIMFLVDMRAHLAPDADGTLPRAEGGRMHGDVPVIPGATS